MPFGYGYPPLGWGGVVVGLLLLLILLIALVIWIVLVIGRERQRHGPGQSWGTGPSTPSSDALKILDERFARGEIDADEYTERRDLLKGSS